MMKVRFDQKLLIAVFCGFLAVMSVLFFFLPKADFSETEKRYLEEAPVFSWKDLSSGKLGEDIESYMADHIPLRNFFVGLNAYTELFTGRQISKGVYLAQGDRIVQDPVDREAAQATKNMLAVNQYASQLNIPVDFMLIPTAGWAAEDSIIGIHDPYLDEACIDDMYSLAGENVRTVDFLSVVASHADPASLYYRTDHHWTAEGAFLAYKTYMEELGRSYLPQERFTVETVEGFQGSTYSESALWLIPGEPLELWHGSDDLTVTNGENPEVHAGVFYRERLEEADKYTVYLDGNHSVVTIHNPNAQGKILVIRDSYSNCLGTYLAESYGTVVLVDLRYYKESMLQLGQEGDFDQILVCYSLDNFYTDTNLVWLGQ